LCIYLHPAERDKIVFMLVFVFQHTFSIREAGLKRVTHAIFFCLFNVFLVYFYSLNLQMYFLTTSHSEIFSFGNRSPGVSAVVFYAANLKQSYGNKYSEYETNRWVYLARRAVGMTHLDRRMLDLSVRWLTRPVAPYGDSSNYVSGVRSFVVRRPCICTLWCEYWSVRYERNFLRICGLYKPGKWSAGIQAISDTVPRDGANRAQKLRLGLLSIY